MGEAPIDRGRFPRRALLAGVAMVGFSLVAVTAGRLTGVGVTGAPEAELVAARELRFEDRAEGGVAVWADGALIEVLDPGSNGFIRGVMRGFARERRAEGIGTAAPFRLLAWSDGRLSIEDPTTGRRIELEGFGLTNKEAFARLLTARGGVS
jgi:putative photosynthetic complex assembly protein